MLVTLLPMVTDVRPLQLSNTPAPMLVTLLGMVTDVRPLQPVERFISNARHAVGNGDGGQTRAIIECITSNARHTIFENYCFDIFSIRIPRCITIRGIIRHCTTSLDCQCMLVDDTYVYVTLVAPRTAVISHCHQRNAST